MCDICLRVKLSMRMSKKASKSACFTCYDKQRKNHQFCHPIWINDNGEPMYHQPTELLELTEREKLLIQQVSPYVPLQHLQNGSYGSKGHVCAFPQDVHEMCTKQMAASPPTNKALHRPNKSVDAARCERSTPRGTNSRRYNLQLRS